MHAVNFHACEISFDILSLLNLVVCVYECVSVGERETVVLEVRV